MKPILLFMRCGGVESIIVLCNELFQVYRYLSKLVDEFDADFFLV